MLPFKVQPSLADHDHCGHPLPAHVGSRDAPRRALGPAPAPTCHDLGGCNCEIKYSCELLSAAHRCLVTRYCRTAWAHAVCSCTDEAERVYDVMSHDVVLTSVGWCVHLLHAAVKCRRGIAQRQDRRLGRLCPAEPCKTVTVICPATPTQCRRYNQSHQSCARDCVRCFSCPIL